MVVVCAWFRQVFTGMAQHVPYFAEKDKIGKNKKYGGEKRNIKEKREI